MSSEDRQRLERRGDKLLAGVTSTTDLLELAKELSSIAYDITNDFDEQRDAFGDAAGLLANWEENYGYKQDEWQATASDLEAFTEDHADEDREDQLEHITELWENATNQ